MSLREFLYYEEPGITLYCGDCRDVVPYVERPGGVMILDAPYGLSHESNRGASWNGTRFRGDESTDLRDCLVRWWSPRSAFVFGTWKVQRPAGVRQLLIWDKGPASGMGDLAFPWKNSIEEIYVLGDGFAGPRDEAVLRGHVQLTWESRGRTHPTEKPVTLIKSLLRKSTASWVLDPCSGSGPTLEAAKQLGREAIGIEIEPRYCEIAVKRLRQEVLALEADPGRGGTLRDITRHR